MSMADEAARVMAPTEGKTFSRTVSTAVTVYEIPDILRGTYGRFHCKGSAMQVNFGDASVSVTSDQTSTAASTTLTVSDVTGMRIAADGSEHFVVPDTTTHTHFAVLGESAGGQWQWTVTGGG